MKRSEREEEGERGGEGEGERDRKIACRFNILLDLPFEILELVLNEVKIEDIKNMSLVSRSMRGRILNRLFKEVKVRWEDIERISEWKYKYVINKVRILRERSVSAKSEWNISIKPLFKGSDDNSNSNNKIKEIEIELIGSSRCIKYKDDFDSKESEGIENITLISTSGGQGDYSERALFESTHIKRFKGLKRITLKGFTLGKDLYAEEEESGGVSGGIYFANLKEINLVNCVWEYPLSVSDIFSGCRAESVRVEYFGEAMRFTCSERFKAMVNVAANRRWSYERGWWSSVKRVEVVVEGGSGVARPAAAMATAFTRAELPGLESVVLAGWR